MKFCTNYNCENYTKNNFNKMMIFLRIKQIIE